MDKLSDAALTEALKRTGYTHPVKAIRREPEFYPAIVQLARMIQKYEPPVDKAEELWRELLDKSGRYPDSEWDDDDRAAIELLRANMKDEE